jgi:hypothetical protein
MLVAMIIWTCSQAMVRATAASSLLLAASSKKSCRRKHALATQPANKEPFSCRQSRIPKNTLDTHNHQACDKQGQATFSKNIEDVQGGTVAPWVCAESLTLHWCLSLPHSQTPTHKKHSSCSPCCSSKQGLQGITPSVMCTPPPDHVELHASCQPC